MAKRIVRRRCKTDGCYKPAISQGLCNECHKIWWNEQRAPKYQEQERKHLEAEAERLRKNEERWKASVDRYHAERACERRAEKDRKAEERLRAREEKAAEREKKRQERGLEAVAEAERHEERERIERLEAAVAVEDQFWALNKDGPVILGARGPRLQVGDTVGIRDGIVVATHPNGRFVKVYTFRGPAQWRDLHSLARTWSWPAGIRDSVALPTHYGQTVRVVEMIGEPDKAHHRESDDDSGPANP